MECQHPEEPKFAVIESGQNVVSTETVEAETTDKPQITEETFVFPAPGSEVSVKIETLDDPDPPEDNQSSDLPLSQPPKHRCLTAEQQEAINAGAEFICADAPRASQPHPQITGR